MATAFFRTIILYLLLIAGLRLTGKRQIGELEPIELVLTMLLSDLASVPMQDFDSPLINGVVPILTLLALTTLYVVQMIIGAKKKGVESGMEDFKDFLPKQFFPVLAMIVVYLVLMYFVGFYISTALFMVVSLLFLKVKKWQILLSTAVILVLVYCAFTLFLGVKLPMGILFA